MLGCESVETPKNWFLSTELLSTPKIPGEEWIQVQTHKQPKEKQYREVCGTAALTHGLTSLLTRVS